MRLVFICLSLILMTAACQTPVGTNPSADEARKAANARKHAELEKNLSEGCGQGGVTLRRGGTTRAGASFRSVMSGLESGDRVHLCPGRYIIKETISIKDLSNVHISGERASVVAKTDVSVFSINNSRGITIEGIHIVHEIGEGCDSNCVDIFESEDIEVRDCNVDGSGYYGFTVYQSKSVKILDNEIHNCEHGFWGAESTSITLKGNHFYDNRSSDIQGPKDAPMFGGDVSRANKFDAQK